MALVCLGHRDTDQKEQRKDRANRCVKCGNRLVPDPDPDE